MNILWKYVRQNSQVSTSEEIKKRKAKQRKNMHDNVVSSPKQSYLK